MPKSSSRYVDISKLSLNLDGCRFGDPPSPHQQQRQDDNARPTNNQQCSSSSNNNNNNNNNNNGGSDGEKHELSPLSTHHWNHVAQYPQNNKQHHCASNELTSPLGTTYRKEGLSIGHNFLRFQGSTLSTNFNTCQLDIVECVGRGVCSSVWKARRCHHTTNNDEQQQIVEQGGGELQEEEEEEYYALKVFSMRDPQKRIMLIRELKLLCSTLSSSSLSDEQQQEENDSSTKRRQECQCLVELEGAFLDESDGTVTLVLEYMNFGSLSTALEKCGNINNAMPEYAIASIAYQMIWGLGYLHHEGILHRDVKPANVLLGWDGAVKLADFGIVSDRSNNYSSNSNSNDNLYNNDGSIANNGNDDNDDNDATIMNITMIGTTRYMSPERLHGQPYNKSSDIWSLGLILLECICGYGNSPFEHITSLIELVQTLDDCDKGGGGGMGMYIPESTSEGLKEVILGCLDHNPEKRMPASVLIASPWFRVHGMDCVDDAVMNMRRYLATLG